MGETQSFVKPLNPAVCMLSEWVWAGFCFCPFFDQAIEHVVYFWLVLITQNHHCAVTILIIRHVFCIYPFGKISRRHVHRCGWVLWSSPNHIQLTSRNLCDLMATLIPMGDCGCCCDVAVGSYVLYVCILNYVVLTGLPSAPAGPGWPGLPMFPCSPCWKSNKVT